MRARVLFFGMLKDIVGMSREEAEFPEGSDLRSVFAAYASRFPPLGNLSRSIVVARNQEFADPTTRLADGDEVAFLPPVSGGRNTDDLEIHEAGHYFALTRHAIDIRAQIARLLTGAEGAVVTFEGTVRNHTKGRSTRCLDYECYESMALKTMAQIGLPDRPRALGGTNRHGASPGTPADRRDQRGGDRHRRAPARRVRSLPGGHQPSQENRPHLEEGALHRRRSLGGRRVG